MTSYRVARDRKINKQAHNSLNLPSCKYFKMKINNYFGFFRDIILNFIEIVIRG